MKFGMSAVLTALALRASAVAAFSPSSVRMMRLAARQQHPQSRLVTRRLASTTAEPPAASESEETFDNEEEYVDSSIYALQAEALETLESDFLKTMRDRGFLHQCTNIQALDAKLSEGTPQAAYLGFDATADSLHVGSLLQIMILRHLQKSGHKPIVLIGGGTSKVGDPTGKDESRKLLDDADIQRNTDGISKVFRTFLQMAGDDSDSDNSPTDAIMVNNDDWLSSLKYLDFLREYGTQFTINRMLSFESVKQRLTREAPFSFLEFNYMILQAYDFLELYRRHNAILQLGGSDQWGNMVSGTDLGRRCEGAQLFALTAPLITKSDGTKMGKTAGGAIWLNADKLSEYDYWQFWRNTSDEDVIRFLKLFTELDLEEIAKLEQLQGSEINQAKIVLADEATAMLHGRECLAQIHETIQNMFEGAGASTDGLPRIFVAAADLEGEGKRFADLFMDLGLASSKKEARRLIAGGGAKLGDDKIEDEMAALTMADLDGKTEVVLRAGKKRAGVVEIQ
jgi:tyrosyl-tRNA synthetase